MVAAATLRTPLFPLSGNLNEYYNPNALPWFTSCKIQVLHCQGSEAMGLHSRLRDGPPMELIVFVGSFTGAGFWMQISGLMNPLLRDKKRHTRVHKGSAVPC